MRGSRGILQRLAERPSNIDAFSFAEHVTRANRNRSQRIGNARGTRFVEYRDDNRARHTKQTKNRVQVRRSGLERVKGIEPSYSAWKAAALPLSYTRALAMDYHAAHAASTADAALTVARRAQLRPLTPADSLLILKASINNERR